MNLPEFPNFRSIKLSDKEWYDQYAYNLKPYADFNFNTLMVWFNKSHELELAWCNNNIVIRYPDVLHNSTEAIYTLYGNSSIDKTISQVFEYQQLTKDKQIIRMAPQDVVERVQSQSFHITEDHDNSEYILDCSLIASLPGKEYNSKRENCNAFENRYGDSIAIREIDITTPENKEFIYNNYIKWAQNSLLRNNDPEQNEKGVIENILANCRALQYKCLAVMVNQQLASFVLYYYAAQGNYLMPSVIKSNYDYQDIFDYTVNALAKYELDNVSYINFEQDLGIEGLKRYKCSLKPIGFLRKYTISLAS